jgi:hypothetical protein
MMSLMLLVRKGYLISDSRVHGKCRVLLCRLEMYMGEQKQEQRED